MAGSKVHPAALWLPIVVGLVLALGWVALRKPSPPNPETDGAGTAAPEGSATNQEAEQPSTAVTHEGWEAPSNPPLPPPEDTSRQWDSEQLPEPDDLSPAAPASMKRAQGLLKEKQFARARGEAMACLKVDPSNKACQRVRVHSYTQQYPMGETRNILGWCLSAFSSDLDCLRALREFHAAKGQRVEASGISAEIRERFPDEELEMQPLPESRPAD
ncbi:MAG: hypothetical protein H6718_07390 [Polyangiaceae bacterium]|nr:hypothetical protein [Polyangiaceae bacterium]